MRRWILFNHADLEVFVPEGSGDFIALPPGERMEMLSDSDPTYCLQPGSRLFAPFPIVEHVFSVRRPRSTIVNTSKYPLVFHCGHCAQSVPLRPYSATDYYGWGSDEGIAVGLDPAFHDFLASRGTTAQKNGSLPQFYVRAGPDCVIRVLQGE